ncbi:MAG: FAD-binding protein [Caulobacteraceae bacterium]
MQRRQLLEGGLALAGASVLARPAAAAGRRGWVMPGEAGWPDEAAWARLSAAVGGRLSNGQLPDLAKAKAEGVLLDPYWISAHPGVTESSGWLDAWRSTPSAFVLAAESPADVAAAVRFARAHGVRLAVRSAGHSYLGLSCAPGSLLVWLHPLGEVEVHDAFTPQGGSGPGVPALSAGGGAIWMHAYQAASVKAGRYVQGGGCTTVGVGGLVLGGGFGSYSKAFGLAAASLLEAEIVTADGTVRTVNADRDPELFWALKGGGGGTFGIVTRFTLATHELPASFGSTQGRFQAKSEEAYGRLIAAFLDAYAANLHNPHWGEQIHFSPERQLSISMVFQGLTGAQAHAAWAPLVNFVAAHPEDYSVEQPFAAMPLPAREFWNESFLARFAPQAIERDTRPGALPGDYWWAGDSGQVGVFWHAYASAWLPERLLDPAERPRLVSAIAAASQFYGFALHFNKGLAGASGEVREAALSCATNPQVASAFALAIIADAGPPLYFGVQPNLVEARARAKLVHSAMAALLLAAPGAGSYLNETDYFQADWRRAFWGENYPRLLRVKHRVDPERLFEVHHGVGSEEA